MVGLTTQFRERARQQREAAAILMAASDLRHNVTKQIAVTVGQCNAQLLDALADTLDYLRGVQAVDLRTTQTRTMIERNAAIRMAAAQGDWNEFDRLVEGRPLPPSSAPGGTTDGGGAPAPG